MGNITGSNVIGDIKYFSTRYLVDTLGFEKHMRQVRGRRGTKVPEAWFKRPYFYPLRLEVAKIRGHGSVVFFPSYVEKADYEFEIAGRFTESIKTASVAEAIEFVRTKMLFTIFNDFSARDYQANDMELPLSVSSSKGIADKSFGPRWRSGKELNLDENGVPRMRMRLWVGDQLRCDSNFRSIYFIDPQTGKKKCWSFAQVIAWFGKMNQGFEAGDLLGSGTIGNGSIAELSHQYDWLKEGDIVTLEAENIGTLKNEVRFFEMPDPRV